MTDFLKSNVTVMVSKMDTALKFYTETLGLKLINQYGEHWAEIEGPGITIGLHPSREMERAHNLSISFGVKDIAKTKAELEKKGVVFNMHDDTQVKLAFFKDPDGNTLYLAQEGM
ncbi:MAG: VOC family protein [Flavobacteriales bacterium]